jgi:CheY-like chemotaxis protein
MSETTLTRVLCVDDEPLVLSALERNLRRCCPIVTAVGGAAGLEVLREDRSFGVIISDMRMPGMDGAEFLSQARLLAPDAVRVLLTGAADLEAVIKAINGGSISYYLTKPIDKDELVRTIQFGLATHRENLANRGKAHRAIKAALLLMSDVLEQEAPEAWGRARRVYQLSLDLGAAVGLQDTFGLGVAASLARLNNRLEPTARLARVDELLGLDDSQDGARSALRELWSEDPNPSAMTRVVRAAMRIADLEQQALPAEELEMAYRETVEPRLLEVFRKLPARP